MIDPEVLKIIEHFANIEKCLVCNKSLLLGDFHYNLPTGSVCYECYQKHPHCWHCGFPVNKSSPYTYKDEDFVLCQKCNKDKITRKADLRKLHFKMKFYAKEALGIYIKIDKVMLLPSSELNKRKNDKYDQDHRSIGFCQSSTIDYFFKKNISIYLQSGMPYDMMFETLAHEYGHAWEVQNRRLDLSSQEYNLAFREGFAEWVSYHTMKEYGLKENAKEMIERAEKNSQSIYCKGFKEMLELEKKLGSKQAVLEYVKNHNDFKD